MNKNDCIAIVTKTKLKCRIYLLTPWRRIYVVEMSDPISPTHSFVFDPLVAPSNEKTFISKLLSKY